MMSNIEVRDATGKLIHTYEVFAAELGTLVSNDDMLQMAKHNAVDDELVSEDLVDTFTFTVAELR